MPTGVEEEKDHKLCDGGWALLLNHGAAEKRAVGEEF